jgi:hypothetical protein
MAEIILKYSDVLFSIGCVNTGLLVAIWIMVSFKK